MSSGSKAVRPSSRDALMDGGSACSTEDAGQCPWREGAEQDSLPGRRHTAAPEAEIPLLTKLAGLVVLVHNTSVLESSVWEIRMPNSDRGWGRDSPCLPDFDSP
jgi:hypothetical protein